jgi:hypothetical protein
MNTYGLAIRTILNIYDIPDVYSKYLNEKLLAVIKRTIIKAVFMSATPVNNSPTEIVDLLNILIPATRIKEFFGDYSIKKEALFEDERNLKPMMLAKIQNVIKGYVSFLEERDPKHYPERVFVGEPLLIGGRKIPYLKFIKCKMSQLHTRTYKKFYDGTVSLDSQALNDIVIPNPATEETGLFKTKEIKAAIKTAPQKWKDEKQIDIIKQKLPNGLETWILTGEFLALPNLRIYSAKYAKLVELLINNLKKDKGKAIISHQLVKLIGVLLIQEILRKNGFIDENSSPTQKTRCSKCGDTLEEHKRAHAFMPARFITVYGDQDRLTNERNEEKFRDFNNIDGYLYRILLGAKIINEGKDYSEIQEVYITSMPGNIPTLLQILGRSIRRDSSKRLPPEKRFVYTHLLVSSLANGSTYEEEKYYEKMMDYIVIQKIDKVFNEEAIDNSITVKNLETHPSLEMLPLEPKKELIDARATRLVDMDKLTFNAFYADEEITTLIYAIKRMFIEQQSVWLYEDLFKIIKNPPFDLQINTEAISEDSFKIALWFLTFTKNGFPAFDASIPDQNQINSLFNPQDRIIQMGSAECCITRVGKYYMLTPFVDGMPFVDYDSWNRFTTHSDRITINLTKELKNIIVPYYKQKIKFYNQYSDIPIEKISTSLEHFNLQFHTTLLQECISYVFNILTNEDMPFSELHEFYFKMLYFYDKLDLVLFCDHLPEVFQKRYEKFITHDPITYGDNRILKEKNKFNALLMSSIIKSSEPIKFDIHRLNEFLGKTKSVKAKQESKFPGEHVKVHLKNEVLVIPKPKKIVKTFANMLPVGHFLSPMEESDAHIPHLYNPLMKDEWIKATDFVEHYKSDETEVENNIIVGYFERGDELTFKFKIREPIHQAQKFKDMRKNKRGSVCSTSKKAYLLKIAKQLKIKIDASNIKNICDLIKLELQKRELNSRRAHKKGESLVRWFYFHFE